MDGHGVVTCSGKHHIVAFLDTCFWTLHDCATILDLPFNPLSAGHDPHTCKKPMSKVKWFKRNICPIFTARCYASAVLATGLCLSVSVTSQSSTKTAKRRITKTTLHDSPGTLVFWCQRSQRNSTGVTPYKGAECRWGVSKSSTFD